jgi:Tfp pilus assembly protein PilF
MSGAGGLLHDEWFADHRTPLRSEEILALSPAMRAFLATRVRDGNLRPGSAQALVKALYNGAQLRLEYDSSRTRTAAEAFADRAGNCLSLVLMTGALAHALGLQVEYRSADVDPLWMRNGELLIGSGHVSVRLGPRWLASRWNQEEPPLNVDFLSPRDAAAIPSQAVTEREVLAMFMNNRAVEALAATQTDQAYAWSREALQLAPDFAAAYNTLGVVYLRRKAPEAAAATFRHALAIDSTNTRAMSNLATALERLGEVAAAAALRDRVTALEGEALFRDFSLGLAAMQQHDFAAARSLFAREVARADYNHEFHFWLAQADWQLGLQEEARRELERAGAVSTTVRDRERYAAKLAWLRAQQLQ